MVISLQEAIIGEEITDSVSVAIARFSCIDKDVEKFLKQKAFEYEKRDKSRTYLIFDENDGNLLGYFSISLKALPFNENLSKSKIKNIDGFSKDVKAVGIVLIGQFGKDSVLAKNISGSELFNACMERVKAAQRIIGGRFVMLECQEIEAVMAFYKQNGFEHLQRDENDGYLQMIRRL
ncbi:MAG: hypothetical protein FWG70_09015 [Oscillospiraceae bacterium]|nr:hypothetical protein [Oscillospiraceae bacterium]